MAVGEGASKTTDRLDFLRKTEKVGYTNCYLDYISDMK